MNLHDQSRARAFTRREFVHRGLVLASAAASVPAFLQASAFGLPMPVPGASAIPGVPQDRVLVVVQLGGGNDGLNTVIPYGDPVYYRARTSIAIPEARVLRLGKWTGLGLHPQLGGLKDLYERGMLAVVHGVGYPNPNRSHFKSMDIWHTADTTATGDGWLGRYFDSECCGFGAGEGGQAKGSPPGIALGRTAPLAMQGRAVQPVSFESEELFKWSAAEIDKDLAEGYDALNRRGAEGGRDTNADFLLRTALDAQVSSDLIRRAVAQRPLAQYPGGGPGAELGRQLQMVAAMIRANLKTRVYYVSLGGFDTHAQQGGPQGRHAQLVKGFSDALKAFYEDLKKQENDARVMTMVFSEFGRRVGQNASQGTDHGTAAPMFLLGPMVKPGVRTEHPDLRDLEEGDLKFTTDFRGVYAGVLNDWLKVDAAKVLGKSYGKFGVVRG